MIHTLHTAAKAVGIKQVNRALAQGRVQCVFIAQDADPLVTAPLRQVCLAGGVPVEEVSSMAKLGRSCGIAVGSATAAILQD